MNRILALNCGSSSLKYALFVGGSAELRGVVKHIGAGGAADHGAAIRAVFEDLAKRGVKAPSAVGHRLVHGGPHHTEPTLVDRALLASLAKAIPFAPLHLPAELRAIEAARVCFGDLPQVVCFDTTFHDTMPEVARRFPLPAPMFDAGVRRYGFHGLSYEHVVDTIGVESLGRAVIAHLGSGASMAAVRDGKSIETTMGFTPTAGLVMGSRSGDLDPGLLVFLLAHEGFDAHSLGRLVNEQAGLKALSGTTSNMAILLEDRATSPHAAFAVEAFCYSARKAIGALAAVLGGVDTLVFTGGIGERAAPVRAEICGPLRHLGIRIDARRNSNAEAIISDAESSCVVRVVEADEERMIARHTADILAGAAPCR